MSEQEKIENQNENLSEELLHYECEQALLRAHFEEPSAEAAWQAFQQRVQKEDERKPKLKRNPRFNYWILGGSIAAAVVIGVLFYPYISVQEKEHTMTLFTATNTELPITVEEQLDDSDLTNKMVIAKDETEVVNKGAVFSSKEADYTQRSADEIRTSVASIPCGQVYKIILNDGTEVWLNADSRLVFPTRFVGTKRLVRLEGEAYFKVARNENMPFIIETEKITTQVLGTEFNVKTYKNSEAHITLVDGSVKVRMPEIDKEVMLEPGEDIAYADNDFQVKKVDTSYYTQWRDGYFYFDDMHLSDILSDLGRWYNITIEMEQDSLLINQRLHFIADRSEDIDQVMENLNAFEYLSVSKKENKLTVRRKK